MRDPHETFMQRTMTIAAALRWLRDHCNFKCGDGGNCQQIIERADEVYEELRQMPQEKKAEFNKLFEG